MIARAYGWSWLPTLGWVLLALLITWLMGLKFLDSYAKRRPVRIHLGWWSPASLSRDVTETLRDKIRHGRLDIKVAPENLGCDPAKQIQKDLVVVYSQGSDPVCVLKKKDYDDLRLPSDE